MADRKPEWLFCVDPGLTSGVALLQYTPRLGIRRVGSFEGPLQMVGEAAVEFLQMHEPENSDVVIERFVINVRTAKNSQAPWSLKVCGALEWLVYDCWHLDGADTIVYQDVAAAKGLVTNDLLHSMNIWHRGGAGHAVDALRHGVYRLATCGVTEPFMTAIETEDA